MFRDFFIGFVRIHILYHASRGPVYGLRLIEELSRHGYRLSPGTLYPMLSRMERDGFLTSRKETESGRVRKYYRITGKGGNALKEAKEKIGELVNEVLSEDRDKGR
ncbi:lineage-specific thermal regulator protein [bacterium BMS3Bbin06]|nr:lineage-specific thermal regulator protein [bacterium BMS3Abin08]GBE33848.1 lineage-specific thermal regulator protein [bacterium BMS3Bbin06]HDO36630.1 PadR family transcriptional regulator [Nitrospirota bacterium]